MDDIKGNVRTHRGTRYAGTAQSGITPEAVQMSEEHPKSRKPPLTPKPVSSAKPLGTRLRTTPGARSVIDGKNVTPPASPVNTSSFAEVEGDIQWISLNTPRQFNLGWRHMCTLIERKGLARNSSAFPALYKEFLIHLEVTAGEEMVATGAKKTGVRELRYIAVGMVRGKESFVKVTVLGETFPLPKSFFEDCSPALLDLSARGRYRARYE